MLNPNELYTISKILEEYILPVCIQKPTWTGDFHFRVELIEGQLAKGTAFKNGKPYHRLFGEYKYFLSETAKLYGNNTPIYDANGYNSHGLDREGYDRNGFNIDGFNRDGYDHDGFNYNGFNREGYDRNGYDIYGFDANGLDTLGYDKDGFDIAGFNQSGFNRNGYDKNGFDRYGYDEKGFNKQGYNKAGFDINGFDKNGYNHRGFDRNGYNRNGYDHNGYNKDGYNKFGIDKEGNPNPKLSKQFQSGKTAIFHELYGTGTFSRFSTSSSGMLIHIVFNDGIERRFIFPDSIGEFLFIEKTEKNTKKDEFFATEYGKKEYSMEKEFFDRIIADIKSTYDYAVSAFESELYYTHNPTEEGGFFHYTPSYVSPHTVGQKNIATALYRQPYFAKVDYKADHNLYLGKHQYKDIITDWADPKASLYYEYQMYIGNKEYELSIVRNFDIYIGQFYGFLDAYNSKLGTVNQTDSNAPTPAIEDERLLMIISAQREDKNVHDIIASIQANQYRIITSKIDNALVVEGCAGSGKTMILLHRLRYLLRNHTELAAERIFALSPTEMLNIESTELAETLQLTHIKRYSNISFYRNICNRIVRDVNVYWPIRVEHYLPNIYVTSDIASKLYSNEDLTTASNFVKNVLNNEEIRRQFFDSEQDYITEQKNALSGSGKLESVQEKLLLKSVSTYKDAIAGCKSRSVENVKAVISRTKGGYDGDGKDKTLRPEEIAFRLEALNYLLEHPELLSEHTAYKNINKSESVIDDKIQPFQSFFSLFRQRHNLISVGFSANQDFMQLYSYYEKIYDKENRLVDYITDGGFGYLSDIIEACIRDAKNAYGIETSVRYEWEAFWKAYILLSIFPTDSDAQLVFIDEFQDYAASEFEFMFKYFPQAKFNLFGDFCQSISAKGITSEKFSDIIGRYNPQRYTINEDYRNAQEITEYVNHEFSMEMRPVGIHGHVQSTNLDSFVRMVFDADERVALLVKDLEEFLSDIAIEDANIIRTSDDEIKRGVINLMPVFLAKGLEFETVAVLSDEMTNNEKYVGMTRALDELWIIQK